MLTGCKPGCRHSTCHARTAHPQLSWWLCRRTSDLLWDLWRPRSKLHLHSVHSKRFCRSPVLRMLSSLQNPWKQWYHSPPFGKWFHFRPCKANARLGTEVHWWEMLSRCDWSCNWSTFRCQPWTCGCKLQQSSDKQAPWVAHHWPVKNLIVDPPKNPNR